MRVQARGKAYRVTAVKSVEKVKIENVASDSDVNPFFQRLRGVISEMIKIEMKSF